MIYSELPTSITIDDVQYPINKKGDFRVILDIISAFSDANLGEREKLYVALSIFYDFNIPPDTKQAVDKMMEFIRCNEAPSVNNSQPIMDWEQDFNIIVSPINQVLGYECREVNKFTHWWTFYGAFMEIPADCQFMKIIGIRQKRKQGIKLEKWEHEYYSKNHDKVDIKSRYSDDEMEMMKKLLGEVI